jgi:hypothetical protein
MPPDRIQPAETRQDVGRCARHVPECPPVNLALPSHLSSGYDIG